jgi:hypothetical protein
MHPLPKESYFEMSKNFNKFFYMYIFIIYVRSSSFMKNQYFCGLYKKEETYLVKNIIFSTEFYLFYTHHMISRFFMKQLSKRVAREDLHVNFWFQFF